MSSKEDICNTALRWLGTTTIISFDENSVNAKLCRDLYEGARLLLLQEHNWNFATIRVQLARLSAAPAWGFTYQYAIPADFIRMISIEGADKRDLEPSEYNIESYEPPETEVETQTVVVTDETAVYLRYVSDGRAAKDVNKMRPYFQRALASRLTADMALSVTELNSRVEMAEKLYTKWLNKARSEDAMADGDDELPEYEIISAR